MWVLTRHLWGPITYLASVCAAVFTVEVLRSAGSANPYLEWTAIVLIISALTDFGIPNALQWALLGKQKTSQSKIESSPHQTEYIPWIKWALRGFESRYILFGLLFCAIVTMMFIISGGTNSTKGCAFWLTAGVAILSVNFRKLASAFLDGTGQFAISRLILAIPNFLIALIIGIGCLSGNIDLTFSEVAVIAANSYLFAGIVGFIFLCLPRTRQLIPSLRNGEKKHTSSLRWYFLSLSSAVQSQFFYVLAPGLAINEFMVPVFYAQKAVQVSSEFVAQFIKEWAHSARKINAAWKNESRFITVFLSIIPALAGGSSFIYSNQKISITIFTIATLVAIEASLSSMFTCRGHIALMNDKSAPVVSFIFGAVLQSFLALFLVPKMGAAGFYASALISGSLFSYRANQRIFSEIIR